MTTALKAGILPANYATQGILAIEASPAAADAIGIQEIVARGGPKPEDDFIPSAEPEKYDHPWDNPGAWAILGPALKPKFASRSRLLRDEPRFDESLHPRDEHGKFTDSGGGDQSTDSGLPKGWHREDPRNIDERYAVSKGRTRVRSDSPIPDAAVQMIDRLQTEYPVDVKSTVWTIGVGLPDGVSGETVHQAGDPNGTYRVELNASIDPANPANPGFVPRWEAAVGRGVLMPSAKDDPLSYTIAHEYGHIVDGTTGPGKGVYNPDNSTDVQARFRLDMGDMAGTKPGLDVMRSMSKYAASNPQEAMAEGFADHVMTDGESTNPFTRAVWRAYTEAGAIK